VAFPAEYRSSGVTTFNVNGDETVYEQNLGLRTTEIARSIREYNPDSTWHKAD